MSHGINSSKTQRKLRGLGSKPKSKVQHGGRGKKYGLKGRKRVRKGG